MGSLAVAGTMFAPACSSTKRSLDGPFQLDDENRGNSDKEPVEPYQEMNDHLFDHHSCSCRVGVKEMEGTVAQLEMPLRALAAFLMIQNTPIVLASHNAASMPRKGVTRHSSKARRRHSG